MPAARGEAGQGGCEPAALRSAESHPRAFGPSDSGLERSDPRVPAPAVRPPRRREPGALGRASHGLRAAGGGRDSAPAPPVGSARPSRKGPPRLPISLPTPAPLGRREEPEPPPPPARPGGAPDPERLGAHASWPGPRGQRPEPVPRPRALPSRGAPRDVPAARSAGSGSGGRAVTAAEPAGPAVSGARAGQGRAGRPGARAKFGLRARLLAPVAGWKEAGFRLGGSGAPSPRQREAPTLGRLGDSAATRPRGGAPAAPRGKAGRVREEGVAPRGSSPAV